MLNSIRRAFSVPVIRVINSTHNSLCYVHLNPFSSAAIATEKPISEPSNQYSLTVNYLINKCGFSEEKAINASKYLKLCSVEKADSVIALFKNQGFTNEQIRALVRNFPPIITCDPNKTILPKIEFFRSLGISGAEELAKIFQSSPSIFRRSLEKQILPSFNYVKSLFDSNGTSLVSVRRLAELLCLDLESRLLPNVEILREAGVPNARITVLLQYEPRALMVDNERFRKVVEEVKEMGFNPVGVKFILAIQAFRSMSKSTWEKKVAVYKKWGWSDDEILLAFERHPLCMKLSTDKITGLMDYFVNDMGFDSSLLLKRPDLLSHSLEKRIKPRYAVYRILVKNGLIPEGTYVVSIIKYTEAEFLEKLVHRYEKEVPGLLELYNKELSVSKS